MTAVDFSQAPFIAFWEITRACQLSCRHCRARAQRQRNPLELSTEEGIGIIDQITAMGCPLLVITGGDPMMHPDLPHFIEHALAKGLRVSLAPSATPLVTRQTLQTAKDAGLARISVSVDGSTAAPHDAFRGTRGSFRRSMEIINDALAVGLSFQVNTTVSHYNRDDLDSLAGLVKGFGVTMWDLFFLVPTGRGRAEDMLSPQEHEEAFNWAYDLSGKVPFDIKTTAAQHYRRIMLQRSSGGPKARPGFVPADGMERAPKGVNDGNGVVFISHVGDVCPSGFLPVSGGNVRQQPLAEVYRGSKLFRELRDTSRLKGKCGRCEFNRICGGSRARAYAMTGDYLEAEPCCVYQPRAPAPVGAQPQP
ncbi:MAG: TIGR04053 family radical SAM/SPASM domain-containing protein [Chloroflexi bacterium]|nr:TIGR04053 family radical SAM/SPASM domain-containing protein [Chloroflexota bacterium]